MTAERLMTMFRRPFKGRNLGGMESHVLRPMITALRALVPVSCDVKLVFGVKFGDMSWFWGESCTRREGRDGMGKELLE